LSTDANSLLYIKGADWQCRFPRINKQSCPTHPQLEEKEFEDTIGVIRIRNSRKDIQHKVQKDKQLSTKHYTEN